MRDKCTSEGVSKMKIKLVREMKKLKTLYRNNISMSEKPSPRMSDFQFKDNYASLNPSTTLVSHKFFNRCCQIEHSICGFCLEEIKEKSCQSESKIHLDKEGRADTKEKTLHKLLNGISLSFETDDVANIF